MKKVLLLSFLMVCISTTFSQSKQGTINYEKKINIWKRIQDPQRRANVPEFRTTKHVLLFNDTISLYKTIKEEEEMNPFEGGGEGRGEGRGRGGFGGGRGSMFGSNDGDLFKNFSSGMSIQATEQSGKDFLISDSIRKQPWKITGETKVILGYTCHKATFKQKGFGSGGGNNGFNGGWGRNRDSQGNNPTTPDTTRRIPQEVEVVAWFADKLLAPAGPESFGLLPGAILEVNIDNGSMVYSATSIKEVAPVKELKEPKKGKAVTREEFRKIMMDLRQHFGNAVPN